MLGPVPAPFLAPAAKSAPAPAPSAIASAAADAGPVTPLSLLIKGIDQLAIAATNGRKLQEQPPQLPGSFQQQPLPGQAAVHAHFSEPLPSV